MNVGSKVRIGCAVVGYCVVASGDGAFQAMGVVWVVVLNVSLEMGSSILWDREIREVLTVRTLYACWSISGSCGA